MADNKLSLPEELESIEMVQEFWDTRSSADYWDEMEDVTMCLSPTLKAKLKAKKLYRLLGLSSQQVAIIEEKAKYNNIDTTKIITYWVLEHIQETSFVSEQYS
jgi:hypothetical protein